MATLDDVVDAITNLTTEINNMGDSMSTAMTRQRESTYIVDRAMGLLRKTISDMVEIQEVAVGVNRTTQTLMQENTEAINNLGFGAILPLKAQMEFLKAGIPQMSDAVLENATRMHVTGQSVDSLVRLQKASIIQMGLTAAQRDALILSLDQTRKQGRVNMQNLVDAVNAISESVQMPAILGMNQHLAEQVADLTRELGSGARPAIERLISFMFDETKASQRVALGIQPLVDAIVSNRAGEDALRQVIQTMTENTQGYVDSVKGSSLQVTMLSKILKNFGGESVIAARQLNEALKQHGMKMEEHADLTEQTLKAQMGRLFGKLEFFIGDKLPVVLQGFQQLAIIPLILSIERLTATMILQAKAMGATVASGGIMAGIGRLARFIPVAGAFITIGLMAWQIIEGLMGETEETNKELKKQTEIMKAREKMKEFDLNSRMRQQLMLHQRAIERSFARSMLPKSGDPKQDRMIQLLEMILESSKDTVWNTRKGR